MKSNTRKTRLNQSSKRFKESEDGFAIVMTLFFLVTTLVVAGMGIDFMRYKSEALKVQDTADRAALAATKLRTSADGEDEESLDPEEVAISYFTAAGLGDNLKRATVIADEENYREVQVVADAEVDTFFTNLVGLDNLSGTVNSTAIQGVGAVEVSLVLDISHSMIAGGRLEELEDAALLFAQNALDVENGGRVSLNVIAYAGNVNVGPVMFDYLGGERYEPKLIEGADTPGDTSDDVYYPEVSCLLLEQSDYGSPTLPPAGRLQAPHFIPHHQGVADGAPYYCPEDETSIQYAQRQVGDPTVPGTLGYFLSNLPAQFWTGTQIGTKYGLALLDPSSQPAFEHLADNGLVDPAFSDRPHQYDGIGVRKILVVMTDGRVSGAPLPKDPTHLDNLVTPLNKQPSSRRYASTSRAIGTADFLEVCDLAKERSRDVEVYTVAFQAPEAVIPAMQDCASSDAHFFEAGDGELRDVFNRISGQISELRLTQ